MNPVAMATEPDKTESDILNARDRCDTCSAQAYVRVVMSSGALDFCGHHYSMAEAKLIPLTTDLVDERHKLTPRPRKLDAETESVF